MTSDMDAHQIVTSDNGERATMTFPLLVKAPSKDGNMRYHVSAMIGDETFPESTADDESLVYVIAAKLAFLVQHHRKCEAHKHTTSLLMERCQSDAVTLRFLPFDVTGEDHNPLFSTAAIVGKTAYPRAFGLTKKECKKEASRIAYLLHYLDPTSFNVSFTEQELACLQTPTDAGIMVTPLVISASVEPCDGGILNDLTKDPTSMLQEYVSARGQVLSFVEHGGEGSQHQLVFKIACVIDGVVVSTGSSSTKVLAKKSCSHNALAAILSKARQNLSQANRIASEELSRETFANRSDYVAALTHRVLEMAEDAQLERFSKEKIVAAFVMIRDTGEVSVVSVGTGNRCILGKHLTTDGCKVHHSHAEVVARRGLLRFLYHELQTYDSQQPHHLFTPSDSGRLRLHPHIQLHLYISRPPCGDASVFISIANSHLPRKQQNKQGLLRCLMEDGEGAIPSNCEPAKLSLSDLKRDESRLRVMTCSDKICSWNLLGLQGALLSQIIEPIYLSSIMIGSSVGQQRHHIPRAVSLRLTDKLRRFRNLHSSSMLARLQNYRTTFEIRPIPLNLPLPYTLHHPEVSHVTEDRSTKYELIRSRPYSVNWCKGDSEVEVVDGMRGDCTTTEIQALDILRLVQDDEGPQYHTTPSVPVTYTDVHIGINLPFVPYERIKINSTMTLHLKSRVRMLLIPTLQPQ